MTTPQITIVPLGTVYIVSDKGFIASLLGLGDTPWHLVAPTANDIGDRVLHMEALIEKAHLIFASNRAETSNWTAPSISLDLPAPSKGIEDLTLDRLGLPSAHLWRLKKAGVGTVGELCGLTKDRLSIMPGVGPALVNKAIECLATHGLRLTGKVGQTA